MADDEVGISGRESDARKYAPIALLVLFILVGFQLRSYHMDYPVVGYHNWKETHYLTEARNFAEDGFFRYGFFVPSWDYPSIRSDPSGVHSDTFPTISILAALSFMAFGFELWAARIIGILLTTACIPLIYLIMKDIFWRRDMALTAALLMAVNPLIVFFSHNVQLINVSLFFMLLALYLFLLWRREMKSTYFILSFVALSIATLTKYPFLIILVPMLALYPYKENGLKSIKRKPLPYIAAAACLLLVPAWMGYISSVGGSSTAELSLIEPGRLMSKQFWDITPSYMKDSVTWIGLFYAILGVFFLAYSSMRNRGKAEIFLGIYLLASVIYMVLMVRKLGQHSYHYYPLIPLAVMLESYALIRLGDLSGKLRIEGKKIKYLNVIVISFLLVINAPSLLDAINRQFDTQFIGHDIAGEYLREHKNLGDRLMHSSFQAYGILWHSDMMGTRGIPKTTEDIKFAEENLNASWVYTYNFCHTQRAVCFDVYQTPEVWEYIGNNYKLVQFAYIPQKNQPATPIYMLLKRGGSFDINKVSDLLQDKKPRQRYYERSSGKVRVDYINIEE